MVEYDQIILLYNLGSIICNQEKLMKLVAGFLLQ